MVQSPTFFEIQVLSGSERPFAFHARLPHLRHANARLRHANAQFATRAFTMIGLLVRVV